MEKSRGRRFTGGGQRSFGKDQFHPGGTTRCEKGQQGNARGLRGEARTRKRREERPSGIRVASEKHRWTLSAVDPLVKGGTRQVTEKICKQKIKIRGRKETAQQTHLGKGDNELKVYMNHPPRERGGSHNGRKQGQWDAGNSLLEDSFGVQNQDSTIGTAS